MTQSYGFASFRLLPEQRALWCSEAKTRRCCTAAPGRGDALLLDLARPARTPPALAAGGLGAGGYAGTQRHPRCIVQASAAQLLHSWTGNPAEALRHAQESKVRQELQAAGRALSYTDALQQVHELLARTVGSGFSIDKA